MMKADPLHLHAHRSVGPIFSQDLPIESQMNVSYIEVVSGCEMSLRNPAATPIETVGAAQIADQGLAFLDLNFRMHATHQRTV